MNEAQRIIWTALPRGQSQLETGLRLSVHVALHLSAGNSGDSTLDQYPDVVNWPATLLGAAAGGPVTFEVVIETDNGSTTLPAEILSEPNQDVWSALFAPGFLVHSFRPAHLADRNVRSYPVDAIRSFVRNLYRTHGLTVAGATELPAVQGLRTALGAASFYGAAGNTRKQALLNQLGAELSQFHCNLPHDTSNPEELGKAFLQVARFHEPRSQSFTSAGLPAPQHDFHEIIAVMPGYPQLARLLGIVIDLELPLVVPVASSGRVRVVPHWTPQLGAASHDVRPYTRTAFPAFIAEPRTNAPLLAANHRLRLDDTDRYRVVEVDADGAAIKVRQLAENLDRSVAMASPSTPARQAMPSLRSGGLAVAQVGKPNDPTRTNRAQELVTELARGDSLATNAEQGDGAGIILDAEDITRGSRFDVWDEASGRWHSLTARQGSFDFTNGLSVSAEPDQAAVTPAPTGSADGSTADLWLQQTMFRWTGWSLAASQPGLAILPDQTVGPGGSVNGSMKPNLVPVPGSLPRLRFGNTYRVRARAADLAGNGPTFGDPSLAPDSQGQFASPPVVYGRFEPVQSPPLLYRFERTEAESVDVLVLRSNYNVPPGGTDPATGQTYALTAERHVVPPKVSVRMVEQHGLVDAGPNGTPDPAKYKLLHDRDPVVLPSEPVASLNVSVEYLSDPFARGAAFHRQGLPQALLVPFVGAWPDPRTFRMVAIQGTADPSLLDDAQGRRLVIPIEKGETFTYRLSAFLNQADLAAMGIWRWIVDAGPGEPAPPDLAGLTEAAKTGKVWMLTPGRPLTVVHAVRQPLLTPEWISLTRGRQFGETLVTLDGVLRVSRKSTGDVDLNATWPEWRDLGPGIGPPTQPGDTPPTGAATLPLPMIPADEQHGEDNLPVESFRHELGDTKHRAIAFAATATTAFGEYFYEREVIENVDNPLGGGQHYTLSSLGFVPGSVSVRLIAGTSFKSLRQGAPPRGAWEVDNQAGEIWFYLSSDLPFGSDVEVRFVAPPITRQTVQPKLIDVPASSRPAAPDIALLTPTFEWTETRTTGGIVSSRATSLRAYLRRPWWSSGRGEQLGIVTFPAAEETTPPALPQALIPYVTQWGADPVYKSTALPTSYPMLSAFTSAVTTDAGLWLDELPSAPGQPAHRVNVARHDVFFDAAQDLWYADIDIAAGAAYQPIVRLAMARYQPSAVTRANDDVHLSRVTLADFAQLAPGRSATVVYQGERALQVSLFGTTHQGTAAGSGPGAAWVTLQRRLSGRTDELGWETIQDHLPMQVAQGPSGAYWTRDLRLPSNRGRGNFRLLIEQADVFEHQPGNTGSPPTGVGHRLVHSDVIDL